MFTEKAYEYLTKHNFLDDKRLTQRDSQDVGDIRNGKPKLFKVLYIEKQSASYIPHTKIFQCILPISLGNIITETTIYKRVHNPVQMELTEF